MTSKTPEDPSGPGDSEAAVAADLRGLRRHTLLQHVIDRAAAATLSTERVHQLLDAVVSVASDLSLPDVLRRVCESARDLVGARHAAVGVLGDGELIEFTFAGATEGLADAIGHPPVGKGLLGALINEQEPLLLRDLREHPAYSGFPGEHPEMRSLLGVQIRVRDEVFGLLYLTDKIDADEFTDSDRDTVYALAAAAGLAIENARLYDQTRRREQWLHATNETASGLLTRTADAEAFALIARQARQAGRAAVALVATHEADQRMVVRAADGLIADQFAGLVFSAGSSLTGDVYTAGSAREIENLAFAASHRSAENAMVLPPDMDKLGPAVLVPIAAGQSTPGVLVLAKRHGQPRFDALDLKMAEAFANSVALAIELTRAQEDRQRLALFEERDRIARDLHDLVIQRLFALGLGLQGLHRHAALGSAANEVTGYVEQVDLTIREIRKSIFSLHEEPAAAAHGLRADLLRGVQECTAALGFEPTLRLEGPLDSAVPDNLRPDLLAVMRESLSNVAKHAGASEATVTVSVDVARGVAELVVDDDGGGMPEAIVRRSGLANMTRRAERWLGTCAVTSDPDTGTTVHWTVPIRPGTASSTEGE